MLDNRQRNMVISGIVVLAITILAASSFTIESGHVGVISTLGKYDPKELEPGFHLKIPIVQKVYKFNVKLHSATYKGRKDLPDKEGIVYKPYIRVLDNKNLPIGIELTVQYVPKANQASEILAEYGKEYFDKLINPIIRDVVRDVIGKYQAEQIAADRTKIGDSITVQLEHKFQKLPFELKGVLLRDIILPDVVVKKIQEVQIAKQEEQKLAMIERQAEKKQKIKTIEANTKLIEITTKAKADAEKQKIEADAKAYRITTVAKAQAISNKLLSQSITPELIKYLWVQKWTGVTPRTFVGQDKNTQLLLQP